MGKDWRFNSEQDRDDNRSKFNRRAERLAREFSRDVSFRDDTKTEAAWSRGSRSIRKLGDR